MNTATLPAYNHAMDNTSAMYPQAEEATGEATDGEKFLFWQIAKKLCSEKRREQRSAAMKAYRQCLEPTIVPTEILWPASGEAGGAANGEGEMVDLGNLLLPPSAPSPYPNLHTAENDDDGDNSSCVSDVTRELPDIDAPTLYPSLDCLDVEVPDLEVSSQAQGKLQVTGPAGLDKNSNFLKELDETYPYTIAEEPVVAIEDIFGDNHNTDMNSSSNILSACKPNKSNLELDSTCSGSGGSSSLDKCKSQKEQDHEMEELNNLLSQNMANLTLKSSNNSYKKKEERQKAHKLLAIARGEGSSNGSRYSRGSPSDVSPTRGLAYPNTMTAPAAAAALPGYKRNLSDSSPVRPPRRNSQGSSSEATSKKAMVLPSYKRNISESTPVLPKRRLSLDSQKGGASSSSGLCYSSSGQSDRMRLDTSSPRRQPQQRASRVGTDLANALALTPTDRLQKRSISEASPMPPQRRLSLDSRMSNADTYIPTREELGYEDMSVYGRPQIRPTDNKTEQPALQKTVSKDFSLRAPPRRRGSNSDNSRLTPPMEAASENSYSTKRGGNSSFMTPPLRKQSLAPSSAYSTPKCTSTNTPPKRRETMAPTPEELGYDMEEDRCGPLMGSNPRLPCRRNSYSSATSNDSTIATWTLGLYKRRKSLDSTVAPPTHPAWAAPDTTPSQPKRRFSASSVMREHFAATESRWNCALSVDSRDNHYFSMTTHTVSTLGLSSGGSGNRRGCTHKRESRVRRPQRQRQQQSSAAAAAAATRKRMPPRNNSWCSTQHKEKHQKHEQHQQQQPMELEIQPGLFLPLRGSQETMAAWERNFVERTSCMSCETKLICIADAEYVLCPMCKVVSPVLTNYSNTLGSSSAGGVGVGMEVNDPSLAASKKKMPATSPKR